MAKRVTNGPAVELLVSAIEDLAVEMIEQKCQKLSARDRNTMRRRIGKAVALFAEGMQLSPQQRRAEEARQRK